MDTYGIMRAFADSWALLLLFLFFVGVVVWAFRPGSRPVHDDIANSIFRHDKSPGDEPVTKTPAHHPAKEA